MQTLITDLMYTLNHARTRMLDSISLLTGTGRVGTIIIFLIILIELLIFVLFIPLHRTLLKRLHIAKQKLVHQIDEVIYLLTKTQYDSHISKKDLGGDPCMAMMKEMFKSGHFEYLDNISLIQDNVAKVELLLQKQVVSPEKRNEITYLQKKMKKLMFRENLIGIVCSIFTLGIYKLFWV